MKPLRVKALAASGQVTDGPAYVYGIHQEGGADAATCALANQSTSGGTRVMGTKAALATVTDTFPGAPVFFGAAVYATITGTTPITEIYWHPA